MPETPVTRGQLLASVHQLQDGDLLVLRLPADTKMDGFKQFADGLTNVDLPEGVRTLILTDTIAVEVVRPGTDRLITRATDDPGTVVEAGD